MILFNNSVCTTLYRIFHRSVTKHFHPLQIIYLAWTCLAYSNAEFTRKIEYLFTKKFFFKHFFVCNCVFWISLKYLIKYCKKFYTITNMPNSRIKIFICHLFVYTRKVVFLELKNKQSFNVLFSLNFEIACDFFLFWIYN